MTPATASKPKAETTRKERARFAAPLASNGLPLVVTVQRMREIFNAENGRKEALPETGRYIRFKDEGTGVQFYETDDPEEIAYLRERASFGTYTEVPIPKPVSAPVLAQITKLAVRGDVDALVALAQEEEDTHQRQDVIDTIADALENIKG